MTFSAKELEVLYMTLFNSIFSYALEFHLQDESEFEKFQAENEYEVAKMMGPSVITSTRELLG